MTKYNSSPSELVSPNVGRNSIRVWKPLILFRECRTRRKVPLAFQIFQQCSFLLVKTERRNTPSFRHNTKRDLLRFWGSSCNTVDSQV